MARTRAKSFTIVQKGGKDFGHYLKDNRQSLVHIETDDIYLSLGMLLHEDRDTLTVGHCRRCASRGKSEKWEALRINRSRIRDLRKMG